jgi:MFS family permease
VIIANLLYIAGHEGPCSQYKPMIGIGCILWIATMLGIAFSTKLWHFMLTQGVMQGIASGFIFPVCVNVISTCDSPLQLMCATVCISFPMVPEEACLLDWGGVVGKLLRYAQVLDER